MTYLKKTIVVLVCLSFSLMIVPNRGFGQSGSFLEKIFGKKPVRTETVPPQKTITAPVIAKSKLIKKTAQPASTITKPATIAKTCIVDPREKAQDESEAVFRQNLSDCFTDPTLGDVIITGGNHTIDAGSGPVNTINGRNVTAKDGSDATITIKGKLSIKDSKISNLKFVLDGGTISAEKSILKKLNVKGSLNPSSGGPRNHRFELINSAHASNIEISATVSGSPVGISLMGNADLVDSEIYNNGTGIEVLGAATIKGCKIHDNEFGIYGIGTFTILNSSIFNNSNVGILVGDNSIVDLSDSVIQSNGNGILSQNATLILQNNEINFHNKSTPETIYPAVAVVGGEGEFYGNNFAGNARDIYAIEGADLNINNNVFDGTVTWSIDITDSNANITNNIFGFVKYSNSEKHKTIYVSLDGSEATISSNQFYSWPAYAIIVTRDSSANISSNEIYGADTGILFGSFEGQTGKPAVGVVRKNVFSQNNTSMTVWLGQPDLGTPAGAGKNLFVSANKCSLDNASSDGVVSAIGNLWGKTSLQTATVGTKCEGGIDVANEPPAVTSLLFLDPWMVKYLKEVVETYKAQMGEKLKNFMFNK